MLLTDLHVTVASLTGRSVAARAEALMSAVPLVSLVHFAGMPFVTDDSGELKWAGLSATPAAIRAAWMQMLGLSAELTYMNPNGKSLEALGRMCEESNHMWARNWVTVGALISCVPLSVELAFARDSRFFLSWPEKLLDLDKRCFIATATLKSWSAFTAHRQDDSFAQPVRDVMTAAYAQLRELI